MNELLIEKYQTQKKLSELANHDLVKYVTDTHFRVRALSAKLGLKLKYGTPNGVLQDMPAEAEYPVWEPLNGFEAADTLNQMLTEHKGIA